MRTDLALRCVTAALLLWFPALLCAQEANSGAIRRGQLKHLAGAIKGYEIIHDNKAPAKLSDLYRDGLADSLGDFVRPGSGTSITVDSEIDAKSDYTMEPLPELKDLLVREKNPEPGKDKLLAIAKDGAIKKVSVGKTSVAATSATPAGSPSPAERMAAATATPAASALTSPGPSAIAASKPSPTSSAASAAESVIVPPIDAAAGIGAAARKLTDAGFKPVFAAVKAKSKSDEFKIAGQSPRAGENKRRGSVVTVYVYQKYEEGAGSGAKAAASPAASPASMTATTKTITSAQTTSPRLGSWSASASQSSDRDNPGNKIVGTWQGAQHQVEYFPDGTSLVDPRSAPNGPRSHWHITGGQLITSAPAGNIRVYNIVTASDREIVLRDENGQVLRLTRITGSQ